MKSVNTLMQKASNVAFCMVQMMIDILRCKRRYEQANRKKNFCNLVEVYKKINEQIAEVVTRSKRVKHTSSNFNI